MDYNSNIAVFGDHCRAIGIESELILDYTYFDDQNVVVRRMILLSCPKSLLVC